MNARTAFVRVALVLVVAFGLVVVTPALAKGGGKTFLSSDDAKESDEPQQFLPDYSKLVKGDEADWVYLPAGSLKSHKTVLVKEFSSNTVDDHKVEGRHAAEYGADYLAKWLKKEGWNVVESGSADMVIEGNIFNAWEPSGGARFWGGAFANPGAGEELIIKDSKGEILGLIRHKSRGSTVKDAVENGLEDIVKSLAKGK